MLVLSVGLKAQTKTVSGTIVDASGESIIGVNIVVKGTTNGVITDFDGNFTLTNVPEKESFLLLILVIKVRRFQWQDNLYLKLHYWKILKLWKKWL